MQHDADAAENNNNGYNPNDPYSYSYTYTIDQQGNYHYNWQGNWSLIKLNKEITLTTQMLTKVLKTIIQIIIIATITMVQITTKLNHINQTIMAEV